MVWSVFFHEIVRLTRLLSLAPLWYELRHLVVTAQHQHKIPLELLEYGDY